MAVGDGLAKEGTEHGEVEHAANFGHLDGGSLFEDGGKSDCEGCYVDAASDAESVEGGVAFEGTRLIAIAVGWS